MDLDKIIEQTLGVKTKHVRDEELYFSKKLMKEAIRQALELACERAEFEFSIEKDGVVADKKSIMSIMDEL